MKVLYGWTDEVELFMDVKFEKRELAVLLVAAVLSGVCVLYEDAPPEVPSESPAVADNRPAKGRQSVAGLDAAQVTTQVRNPFSLLHETADDNSPSPAAAPAAVAGSDTAPAAGGRKETVQTAAASEPASPELCGIMQGDTGRLAMLRLAGKTVVLAAGETCQEWTVKLIAKDSVVIGNGGQEKRLFLPSF